MGALNVGFVTGSGSFWRQQSLAVKHRVERLTGAFSPDVYALPRFLGDGCVLLRDGQSVAASKFDLIFSELNGSDSQLEYLDALVAAQSPPVAVVPGPPEILASSLTDHKLRLVRRILRNAGYVLAYSQSIASFYDGLIGQQRSQVIPWPFDYEAVRRLAGSMTRTTETIRVVLNVPLCFAGRTENYPFVLKAALLDAMAALSLTERQRFSFHSFVYNDQDREGFTSSGFADGMPVTLEARRRFRPFVHFLGGCDAVVNLTASNILGRVTFLSAALDKPGLFTANAEISKALYPGSTVPLLDPIALREGLTGLLSGLVDGNVPSRFMPDSAAARSAGDFAANARIFGSLFSELGRTPSADAARS